MHVTGIILNIKPIGTVQYWLIPDFVGSSNECQAVNHTVAVYKHFQTCTMLCTNHGEIERGNYNETECIKMITLI